MLIQNMTMSNSAPAPAPAAMNGNAGSLPSAVPASPAGSAPVELPQTAVAPVGNNQGAQPGNQAAQPSNAQLQEAVGKLNQLMMQSNTNLQFSIDRDTKQTLIKVVDSKTGETIKQFPSEEAIAISKSIDQFQKGILFRQKA